MLLSGPSVVSENWQKWKINRKKEENDGLISDSWNVSLNYPRFFLPNALRRFTYRHLSQLKYILPEVIEINKDLVFDEQTSCMKPDLRITLNAESVGKDGELGPETGPVDLRKLFHIRLLDFIKTHPEVNSFTVIKSADHSLSVILAMFWSLGSTSRLWFFPHEVGLPMIFCHVYLLKQLVTNQSAFQSLTFQSKELLNGSLNFIWFLVFLIC